MRKNTNHFAHRLMAVWTVLVLSFCLFAVPAYAASDPLDIVSNLSDFIFSIIKALGPSSPTMPASGHRASSACSAGL